MDLVSLRFQMAVWIFFTRSFRFTQRPTPLAEGSKWVSVTAAAVGVRQEKQRLGVNTVRLGCPGLETYQGTDKELSHLSEFLELRMQGL